MTNEQTMNKMTRDKRRTGDEKKNPYTHKLKMKEIKMKRLIVVVVNGSKNETNTFSICHHLFHIYKKCVLYVQLDVETFS